MDAAPNQTLCADDHLVRVGFMQSADVEAFVNTLGAHGIHYLSDDTVVDLVVVDQQRGPMVPCEWLQFGRVTIGEGVGESVAGCRFVGDTATVLATPDDWVFEGSLSQRFGFAPSGDPQGLKFLRHEDGLDVYLSELTGDEVFVGRTSSDS